MEFNMEWNVICRVCLQEGEMRSIFDQDEKDMLICDKMMLCSSLRIERGQNLPEQICTKCLEELSISYRFRNNCESSNAVLESFAKGGAIGNDLIVCSVKGKIYKYDPPEGLNVKLIRKSDSDKVPARTVLSPVEENSVKIEEDNEIIIDEHYIENENDESLDEETYEIAEILEDDQSENDEDEIVEKTKPIRNKVAKKANTNKKQSAGSRQPRSKKNAAGEKPLSVCELCGNSYKQKHALDTHMRRHRNEKPFSCEICGRAFVLNVELTCHMRTHTGQKPYECRHCDRRFSDFGSRIKHERSHTGERPYKCETCGKAFAYSYGLSSHILTHTGEKRYECEKCGKRFTKKHHLTNHLKTHLKQENKLRAQKTLLSADNITKKLPHVDVRNLVTVLTTDQSIDQYVEEVSMIDEDGDEFQICTEKSMVVYSPAYNN